MEIKSITIEKLQGRSISEYEGKDIVAAVLKETDDEKIALLLLAISADLEEKG